MPCTLCLKTGHNRRTCTARLPYIALQSTDHLDTVITATASNTLNQLNRLDNNIVGSIHNSEPTWVHVYNDTDYHLKDWFIHIIQYHFNWTRPDIIMYNILTPQCEAHLKLIIESLFHMYDKRLVIICKDEELPAGVEKGILNAIECLYYHSLDQDFPDSTDTPRLRNGVFFKILTEFEQYLTPILRIACNGEPLGFRSGLTSEEDDDGLYITLNRDRWISEADDLLLNHEREERTNTLAPIVDSPCISDDCPICMESLLNTDLFTTRCGHMYHGTCMIKHIKTHDTCPMCRGVLHI